MDLLDIKEQFRNLSGRYDLVDDDVSGTARFLINQACRYLDRKIEHQKSYGSYFGFILANAFNFSIPLCRAIKEVWVSKTDLRYQLEKRNIQELIVDYLSSQPTSGDVWAYAPVITRKFPEDADLTAFSTYMQFLDTMPNAGLGYNGIVILPPTDVQLLVEVRGYFYSRELVNDNDENFWTVNHPLTLMKAIFRELDILNQNASKVDLWNKALGEEIIEIEKDLINEDITEVENLEKGIEGEIR